MMLMIKITRNILFLIRICQDLSEVFYQVFIKYNGVE